MRGMVLATFMVSAFAGAASAGAFELKLTVEEPSGVARSRGPASGGIPLTWGAFRKEQEFALFQGGREIPAQVLPLVVDEKGCLRWVLVDLQTDLPAGGKKEFTLKAAKPRARPASPIKVSEGADGVTVDTGKIRFTMSRSRPFSLFSSVEAGGRRVVSGGQVSYTDCTMDNAKGERYLAEKPSKVEVEYLGPMRVTVCARGRFRGDEQSKLGYVARVTARAGRSDVHVKYSLTNSNPDHYCYRQIKDSSIELKLAGEVGRTLLGAREAVKIDGEGWMHAALRANVEGHTKVGKGEKIVWTGNGSKDRVEGWIAADVGGTTVFACDLYFADDLARRLATDENSLVLTGVAERWDGPMDKRRPERKRRLGQPYGDKWRWLFDCAHVSSQYVIDFAAPSEASRLSAKAKAARGWLHLMAPPAWYFETEGLAVGRFGTQADELKCYDTWGWKYDPNRAPQKPGLRSGRYVQYEDNHYETEEDIVESLLLMYLRTGRRDFLTTCQAWANYEMDLQKWRTDGWRYKDGGVWWPKGGPLGNRPQRGKDRVTGRRNSIIPTWAKSFQEPFDRGSVGDLWNMALSRQCYCHNYGSGIAAWFCITGERDALEAAIDSVEQNYDTQKRAFRREPGKTNSFSRDFTRSSYLISGIRLAAPTDPFVVEASDWLAKVYLERPQPEVRGLIVAPGKLKGFSLDKYVGRQGIARMKELGVTFNQADGLLHDPKTGASWYPLVSPHTWMFPPLSGGIECYYRMTGDEDAHDWVIAYGQAVARILFQEKHSTLAYGRFLVDFPTKGFAWDWASWQLPEGSKTGEGVRISGYLARFHPDVPARAYSLCGEQFLKKRAHDYWYGGSHRGYNASKMHKLGAVGSWINCYGVHSEFVCFTGRTIYEWSHPRRDEKPPAKVTNLAVRVAGKGATVSFTAPADGGGGKVVRYQVKCSERPIVEYEEFLDLFKANKDEEHCNWWMASNLKGEPAPKAPGKKERFTVTGVPEGARHFAVRSFDDSKNRSALSNLSKAR